MNAIARIAQSVLVLFLAYVFVFLILSVLPGDPITNRLSDPDSGLTRQAADALIGYYGLDRPTHVQFVDTLVNALRGDFGRSLIDGKPVTEKLIEALPSTLALAGSALLAAVVLAVVVSLLAVYGRWPFLRAIGNALPSFSLAVPSYIFALLLIQVFSFQLHWFVSVGDHGAESLVLPAIALGIPVSAPLAQVFTDSIRQRVRDPFVTVSRARGLGEVRIFITGLLKVSSLPALTVLGLAVGTLIGGAVITESVFGRAGLGSLVQKSVAQQDLPVLQAIVLLSALVFLVVNLVVDLVYPALDPRIRSSRTVAV